MTSIDKITIPYVGVKLHPETTVVKGTNNYIRKIEVVYNYIDDTFRIKLDMVLSGNSVYCQGVIIPEKSYDKSIYIDIPKDALKRRLSSVTMLSISASDFPNTFMLIKSYVHTIGDILDNGADYTELPYFKISSPNDSLIFKDSRAMAYQELLQKEGTMLLESGKLPNWALWKY